jgi:hypothetical protein
MPLLTTALIGVVIGLVAMVSLIGYTLAYDYRRRVKPDARHRDAIRDYARYAHRKMDYKKVGKWTPAFAGAGAIVATALHLIVVGLHHAELV